MCKCTSGAHDHALYVTRSELDAIVEDLQGMLAPIGTIRLWTASIIPTGWLVCDGMEYSGGPGEYPLLFGVIGTAFNVGGETGFRVPNLQGRFPVGLNPPDDAMNAIGDTGGEANHILTEAEMPSHDHDIATQYRDAGSFDAGTGPIIIPKVSGTAGNNYTKSTAVTGSGDPHNNLPPYLALVYIIRAA